MSNEIKRMKYFNGLLLKEEDLALEQEYHMKLQRLHNRFFHDWGVVDGLTVTPVGGYPQVTVSQGLALNRIAIEETNEKFSQEIWICENHPDNPVDLSGYDANKDIYITVVYEEAAADKDNKKGGDKEIHIWERGRIKHRGDMPPDPSKEVVLARVRLTSTEAGGKTISEVSEKAVDGITQIRTYAVTQGTAQEFAKISIGEKDKLNLPYLTGFIDRTLGQNDGLEIHAPYTKFSGKVISGELKANGDVNVNGVLTVNANNAEAFKVDSSGGVNISKNAVVAGTLSAAGGMQVSGENTTLNTTNVVMTGNMLTVSKYTPKAGEIDPRIQSSGFEVFRGGERPNAKLVWDEASKSWKAGTDAKDGENGSGLFNLAYGPDWEKIHNGSNADELHKHSKVFGSDGKAALTADDKGNIDIDKNITVTGSIVAKGGIEVPSKETSARLVWNEEDQRWQIGMGTDLYNIPYGKSWQDLTSGTNADLYHSHSEFYNGDGNLVMSATPIGDVKVYSNLAVAKNLTVDGNLTVKNKTEFTEVQQVVTESVVVVNKPNNGQQPVSEGGLEVYRGEGLPNARLIWDEGSDKWKLGTGSSLIEIPSGIEWEYLTHGQVADELHSHGALTDDEGTPVVDVDADGNVLMLGDLNLDGAIAVEQNASVKGDMDVDGSVIIKGDLTIKGKQSVLNTTTVNVENNTIVVNRYTGSDVPIKSEGGLEVYRGGGELNAKLLWNEAQGIWKIGIGNNMKELPYGEKWENLTQKLSADKLHNHSMLCDKNGTSVIGINTNGDIGLGKNTKVNGTLGVEGSMTVKGDLDVIGTVTSVNHIVNKIENEVEDSIILLNKFEGSTPPLNESGIEIFRGDSKAKARLIWDEAAQSWKIGLGDELKEIASGKIWDKLTSQKNADSLHKHGQLYNEKGDILSLSTRATGSVDVAHDLTVGQDLKILGNLDVGGGLTRINSSNIEVVGNSITLNRFDSGELKKVDSGISIFRGNTQNSAILAWDETKSNWKIGMSNGTQYLRINQDGSIQTPSAAVDGELTAGSAYIKNSLILKDGIQIDRDEEPKPVIKWVKDLNQWIIGVGQVGFITADSKGNVGIGNSTPRQRLDVTGSAVVSGDMNIAGNSSIVGALTAGSAEVKGNLKVTGGFSLNNGIEVDRGEDNGKKLDPAKIIWKEADKKWYLGYGDQLDPIILNSQHTHSKLYSPNGSTATVTSDANGNVGIGSSSPGAKLDVGGDAIINGKLQIKDSLEVTGSTFVNGKVTAKNSFEIYRDGADAAKLYWNEDSDTWQAGFGSKLENISLSGHNHNSLYSGSSVAVFVDGGGNVGIGGSAPDAKLDVSGNIRANGAIISGSISAAGSIRGSDADISGVLRTANATITQNLTVEGNLTVNGEVVTVNTKTLDVEDNIITINKYSSTPSPANTSAGIEVYRGGTAANAQLLWNETAGGVWQAGTTEGLKNFSFDDHKHVELTQITGVITAKDGKVGIGTASPSEKLEVEGNADISGKIFAGEAGISGLMTAASASISGTLAADTVTAGDISVSGTLNAAGGVEYTRSGETSNARLRWSETDKMWQAGIEGELKNISLKGHTHDEITNMTGVLTVKAGNVGIGNTNPARKLDISGDAGISGSLTADAADFSGVLTLSQGIKAAGAKKGRLIWDEEKGHWLAGTEDSLETLGFAEHKHNNLFTEGGEEILSVNSDGNIGIGKVPDEGVKLDVDGIVKAVSITQTSSAAYKENIEELPVKTALELLKGLNPVSYDYRGNYFKKHNIGFIAEEVPEIFTTSDSKSISIMDIVAVLTAVVKKQQSESATMRKQLNALQKQVAELIGA